LTNAKKKVISEEEWVSSINNNQFTFAVKKGTTYYFLVTSNGVSAGNFQSITVKNTAIKEKSGAKKKKAVAIKAKKTVKGTILPESKAADWYKITVKKKKAVTINFNCNVTGGLVITVYTKGGKKIGDNTNSGSNQSLALTYSTTYQKVNKGTYYIKISRKNSLSSGTYSLKWK
jgi:methionine-rich copper-binding protein CopC